MNATSVAKKFRYSYLYLNVNLNLNLYLKLILIPFLMAAFAAALFAPSSAVAQDKSTPTDADASPYASISARNLFNLVPIPTNPPVQDIKPAEPPAKITPNGIMDLFGNLQVLFKVAAQPKPGQATQENSYTLGEGDRQDGIEVIKIDKIARIITFDNHGVIQKIPMADATGGGESGGNDLAGGPGFGRHHGRPEGLDGGSPGANQTANFTPKGGSGAPSTPEERANAQLQAILNDPNHLTPEAQVIAMEFNRQQLQAAGDDTAALIPPTELTDQTQGNNSGPSEPNNGGEAPSPGEPGR